MPFTFSAAGATHLGTVRVNNEDAAYLGSALVALADGMGGHAAGEVASAVVIHGLSDLDARRRSSGTPLDADGVTATVQHSRDVLRHLSDADPDMAGMGTTLVALAITPAGVVLAHVGDSRLYRLRDGLLSQLTIDHTHVQKLVEAGRLAPDQVRHHPFRSVILRSIDDTSDDLPDVGVTDRVAVGDRLLLCSDGLSDYVPDDVITAGLADGTPQVAADRLVALALDHSTRDNVTAVVVDVLPTAGPELTDDADVALSAAGLPAAGLPAAGRPAATIGATLTTAELSANAAAALAEHLDAGLLAVDGNAGADAVGADEGDTTQPLGNSEPISAELPDAEPVTAPEDLKLSTMRDSGHVVASAPSTGGSEDPAATSGNAPTDVGIAPTPDAATSYRPTRSDLLWLALVVVAFLSTTAVVGLTER